MGFIEETGAAQHYRDARITTIYEGTTGIQANDLDRAQDRARRRRGGEGGRARDRDGREPARDARPDADLQAIGVRLAAAEAALERAIDWIVPAFGSNTRVAHAGVGRRTCGCGASSRAAGRWRAPPRSRSAKLAAREGDSGFLHAKVTTARFYADALLPWAEAHAALATGGGEAAVAMRRRSLLRGRAARAARSRCHGSHPASLLRNWPSRRRCLRSRLRERLARGRAPDRAARDPIRSRAATSRRTSRASASPRRRDEYWHGAAAHRRLAALRHRPDVGADRRRSPTTTRHPATPSCSAVTPARRSPTSRSSATRRRPPTRGPTTRCPTATSCRACSAAATRRSCPPAASCPVVLFSHGYAGSPIDGTYLGAQLTLASFGYVTVAPFHGDLRWSLLGFEAIIEDGITAETLWTDYVAMQALRPITASRMLDALTAHAAVEGRDRPRADRRLRHQPGRRDDDAARRRGAHRRRCSRIRSRSRFDSRLSSAVGYIPFFGMSFLPSFGRDQEGVDGVTLPFLAIAGTDDNLAQIERIEQAVRRLGGTRIVVAITGLQHDLEPSYPDDIFTWSIVFIDSQLRGDPNATAKLQRMTSVSGGGEDVRRIDYTAPSAGDRRRAHRDRVLPRGLQPLFRDRRSGRGRGARHRLGRMGADRARSSRRSTPPRPRGCPTAASSACSASVSTHFYTINADECAGLMNYAAVGVRELRVPRRAAVERGLSRRSHARRARLQQLPGRRAQPPLHDQRQRGGVARRGRLDHRGRGVLHAAVIRGRQRVRRDPRVEGVSARRRHDVRPPADGPAFEIPDTGPFCGSLAMPMTVSRFAAIRGLRPAAAAASGRARRFARDGPAGRTGPYPVGCTRSSRISRAPAGRIRRTGGRASRRRTARRAT